MNPLPEHSQPAEPRRDRPGFPKDYGVPTGPEGLLPWSHARERLEKAVVYWIVTATPSGRPHVTPVWGVWLDESLFFDGAPETRRVRNMTANPAVAVHLESGGDGKDIVILEGEAREIPKPDRALTTRIAAAYAAKYASEGYKPGVDTWDAGGLYVVRPRVVFAWTNLGTDPTRWRFEPA